jgi:hypothetical protein
MATSPLQGMAFDILTHLSVRRVQLLFERRPEFLDGEPF